MCCMHQSQIGDAETITFSALEVSMCSTHQLQTRKWAKTLSTLLRVSVKVLPTSATTRAAESVTLSVTVASVSACIRRNKEIIYYAKLQLAPL